MGFRIRKSIKIAPGLRLNVSSKNVGLSAGVRGARISANTNGRVTRTVGVPAVGLFYTKSTAASSRRSASDIRRESRTVRPPKQKPVKPGFAAPAWEKQLYQQICGRPDAAAIYVIAQQNPSVAPTAAMVEILRVAGPNQDIKRVQMLLGWLFDVGYDPAIDSFITKYVGSPEVSIPIATGVTAEMRWNRQALGLIAAERERAAGNRRRAIDIVEVLEPTTVAAVSLADLYAAEDRWADIVDLTNGLSNDDAATTFLLIQRGTALREQGYFEAARESFREALRVRTRPPELRHLAWFARGCTYLRESNKTMARKDFERVLAEDATYPGLGEMLSVATS